jgi:hypothetical protein
VGDFNIVRDYDWTTIPRGSGYRNRAPRVLVQSFKVKSSESLNRIKSYTNVVANTDADKFYDKLYSEIADPEDRFRFPFFGDNVRSFSNEYGDTFQSAFLGGVDSVLTGASKLFGEMGTYVGINNINGIKEGVGAAMEGKSVGDILKAASSEMGKGYSTAPGSYIETPKLYQYAQNDAGLEVSIVLDNTLNADNDKNTKLVEHLTRINRPKRINSIIMEPPRIYKVILSGIRYMRWASCSNFSVQLLGAKRMIDNKIVPEGYLISMTFTSLTTEVSNFMDKITENI